MEKLIPGSDIFYSYFKKHLLPGLIRTINDRKIGKDMFGKPLKKMGKEETVIWSINNMGLSKITDYLLNKYGHGFIKQILLDIERTENKE